MCIYMYNIWYVFNYRYNTYTWRVMSAQDYLSVILKLYFHLLNTTLFDHDMSLNSQWTLIRKPNYLLGLILLLWCLCDCQLHTIFDCFIPMGGVFSDCGWGVIYNNKTHTIIFIYVIFLFFLWKASLSKKSKIYYINSTLTAHVYIG